MLWILILYCCLFPLFSQSNRSIFIARVGSIFAVSNAYKPRMRIGYWKPCRQRIFLVNWHFQLCEIYLRDLLLSVQSRFLIFSSSSILHGMKLIPWKVFAIRVLIVLCWRFFLFQQKFYHRKKLGKTALDIGPNSFLIFYVLIHFEPGSASIDETNFTWHAERYWWKSDSSTLWRERITRKKNTETKIQIN